MLFWVLGLGFFLLLFAKKAKYMKKKKNCQFVSEISVNMILYCIRRTVPYLTHSLFFLFFLPKNNIYETCEEENF